MFTLEESHPPIISENIRNVIKASDQRGDRHGADSRDSSSKRSRKNSRDTGILSNVDLVSNVAQISNRTPNRFANNPKGCPFVDSEPDAPTVKKVFSSQCRENFQSGDVSSMVRWFQAPSGKNICVAKMVDATSPRDPCIRQVVRWKLLRCRR